MIPPCGGKELHLGGEQPQVRQAGGHAACMQASSPLHSKNLPLRLSAVWAHA